MCRMCPELGRLECVLCVRASGGRAPVGERRGVFLQLQLQLQFLKVGSVCPLRAPRCAVLCGAWPATHRRPGATPVI